MTSYDPAAEGAQMDFDGRMSYGDYLRLDQILGAQKTLTATVLAGSNPYESHWKGKVSGLAMPPNAVAISQADASKLVKTRLILTE